MATFSAFSYAWSTQLADYTGKILESAPLLFNAGAGPGADTTPPTIGNVSPASGTELTNAQTPIEFDVTDLDPGLVAVIVTLKYSVRNETLVVWNGAQFVSPFNSLVSERTVIANGYHFKILPQGGWLSDISQLFVYAIDAAGNVEALP